MLKLLAERGTFGRKEFQGLLRDKLTSALDLVGNLTAGDLTEAYLPSKTSR